jgi:hypothetical protein
MKILRYAPIILKVLKEWQKEVSVILPATQSTQNRRHGGGAYFIIFTTDII